MNRSDCNAVIRKLFFNRVDLLIIRSNDSDSVRIGFDFRQCFRDKYINLTTVHVSSRMVADRSPYHGKDIRFAAIISHNYKIAVIEFLIAEIYYFRMTSVMFAKKRSRNSRNNFAQRRKETVVCKVIALRKIKRMKHCIGNFSVVISQDIRQLFGVADYYCMTGVRKS